MDYETLLDMDADVYMDTIEKLCNNCLDEISSRGSSDMDFILDTSAGHTGLHIGMSENDVIHRMIFDKTPVNGSFPDRRMAELHILNAIVAKSQTIEEWFHAAYPAELPEGSTYERLVLDVNMRENTGFSISKNYREYSSEGVVIILDRDTSGCAPLGFSMTTAYPSMQYSEPTSRSFNPLLVALSTDLPYKSVADRVFAYARVQSGISAFRLRDDTVLLRAQRNDGLQRVDMYLHGDGSYDLYRKLGSGRKRLDMDTLKQENPALARKYSSILGVAQRAVELKGHAADSRRGKSASHRFEVDGH